MPKYTREQIDNHKPVAHMQEVGKKRDLYMGEMTAAAYPLFFAATLDILSAKKAGGRRGGDILTVKPDNVRDENYRQFGNQIDAYLSEQHIPSFRLPLHQSYRIDLKSESDITTLKLKNTGNSERHMTMHGNNFYLLADRIGAIYLPSSLTSKTIALLDELNPNVNLLYMRRDLRKVITDGFFSTLLSAEALNLSPIVNGPSYSENDYPPRRNLKAILESPAIIEMTRIIRVNVLTQLATLGVYPTREVEQISEELHLHKDMETYIKYLNTFITDSNVKPLVCPFAIALGTDGVEAALTYYQGKLPQKVQHVMQQNQDVTGIALAGQILSQLFFS